MRREKLQKIHRTEASIYKMIPKTVVATGPNNPVIASLDLVGGKFDAAIHVFEVVFICGRKRHCHPFCTPRLVEHRPGNGLPFSATYQDQHTSADNKCNDKFLIPHSVSVSVGWEEAPRNTIAATKAWLFLA